MNLTTASTAMNLTIFRESTQGTNFFGVGFLLFLVLIFILILLITRDTSKWITVGVPLYFALHALKIPISTNQTLDNVLFPVIGGILIIMWTVNIMSLEIVGNMFNIPILIGNYEKARKARQKRQSEHEKEYFIQDELQRQSFNLEKELGNKKTKTAQEILDDVVKSRKYRPSPIKVYRQ